MNDGWLGSWISTLLAAAALVGTAAGCGDAPVPAGTDGGMLVDDGGGGAPDLGSVAPDAALPRGCDTPGAIETTACGMCGTVDRFCSASHEWSYGTCTGETGACAPGATRTSACGHCGTQQEECTASCTWSAVGSCSGEGVCMPGARARSGDGCAAGQTRDVVCSVACALEPAGECVADGCTTPGAIETVSCGNCGHQDRFCDATRAWQYGACTGEGVCTPGTTSTSACGMCGMQMAHCLDTCTWSASGTCGGEGSCMPGTTTRTSAGCPAGQTQVLQCDAACGYTIVASPCTSAVGVDVVLLLDVTGSNAGDVSALLPTLRSRMIAPLLGMASVSVGIAYFGEFPVMPYGLATDRPFEGGIEPGTSLTAIDTELATRPMFGGADAQDAAVEALSMLAGGGPALASVPMTCSAGRALGGCWRSGARRVVVVFTDSQIHDGPDPATGGLLVPYAGITPAPATWPDVRTLLHATGTTVIFLDSGVDAIGRAQFDTMLSELGQPTTDHLSATDTTSAGAAADAVVARVRAAAM